MTLEEAVEEFYAVSNKLSAFLHTHRDLVDQYEALTALCSDAEKKVKALATSLPGDTERTIGSVTVKKTVQLTVDPISLRAVPGAENIDGLFLPSIDTKVLDAAVKAGVLKREHVDVCRTIPYRTTIRVTVLDK